MQFSKLSITALFTLLATTSVAAPAADSVDARSAEAAPGQDISADEALEKRGFGCPDDSKCHNHVSRPSLNINMIENILMMISNENIL
jgi:hypothetical protein